MTTRRRRGQFSRVTRLGPDQLGLPARQGRELVLKHAWESVAGPNVARRVPALGITRGILELEVPDDAWAAAVRDMLPTLAGRLAARYPELRVRKFRLVRPGSERREKTSEIPEVPREATAPKRESPARTGRSEDGLAGDATDRLAAVAERYLRSRKSP